MILLYKVHILETIHPWLEERVACRVLVGASTIQERVGVACSHFGLQCGARGAKKSHIFLGPYLCGTKGAKKWGWGLLIGTLKCSWIFGCVALPWPVHGSTWQQNDYAEQLCCRVVPNKNPLYPTVYGFGFGKAKLLQVQLAQQPAGAFLGASHFLWQGLIEVLGWGWFLFGFSWERDLCTL